MGTLAVGVLAALRMYTSWISLAAGLLELNWRWSCERRAPGREDIARVAPRARTGVTTGI